MIGRKSLTPATPALDRAVEARAIAGFMLLRQLGFTATVVVPLSQVDIVGPAESRERAEEVVELWRSALCRFASWAASALDDASLAVGTEIFRSDDDSDPALFEVRKATLEELAVSYAGLLRAPRGLSLRRAEANAIAQVLDGLTQSLAAERAARGETT